MTTEFWSTNAATSPGNQTTIPATTIPGSQTTTSAVISPEH